MSWESIGSVSTGEMPHDEEWIMLSLSLAKTYVEAVCGEAPAGSSFDIMWQEGDPVSFPSLGVWCDDDDVPVDYVNACERALAVFDGAVSWHELHEQFRQRAVPGEGDEDEAGDN
ncbi:MAG: hypothetical protein ABJB04_02030 [Betaproteobacteria bacterium]